MRRARLAGTTILAILFLVVVTLAQSQPTLRGGWSATAAPNRVFQGTWTAKPVPGNPEASQGSWTLVNGSNQIVARGAGAAVTTARVWSGTWQARVATGQLLSGSWRTQVADASVRTLGELLQKTLSDQVNGTWARGRLTGAWSLRAFP